MALQIHTPFSLTALRPCKTFFHAPTRNPNFSIIRSENPQIESESSPKRPNSAGLGFGPPSKSKKVIRRAQVDIPALASKEGEAIAEEQRRNENTFLLAWLGLGLLILVEGIALAASGFLPEEWDKFLVKYLYPIFTPTIGLFLAGTVTYGVLKYIQNEKLKSQK